MRKKIFLTATVIGIVAIVAINVQMNFNKNTSSLLLDNIEALTQTEGNACTWGTNSSCTTTWEDFVTPPGGGRTRVVCTKTVTTCDGSGSLCCNSGTTTSCS
jgi:hypothetical protein